MQELGIHIHEEWRGMTQPVGLVVEPIVLDRFGIFPETNIKVISDLQMRLEVLIESQRKGENIIYSVGNFKEFCKQVLNWEDGDLLPPEQYYSEQKLEEILVHLEDYGEILKPDWIVPEINRDDTKRIQIMVQELETGMSFDQIIKNSDDKKIWEATPQQRFERLLKETGNPLGIIWNGISLRLVYAPSGESSGHITFPLEPMTSVDGRPMIGALEMLLGPDRLFEGGTSSLSLRNLMEHSRKEQNEVSERLSEQVLDALWILVRGFDEAEEKAKLSGHTILNDLPTRNPSHIYGGLITVLLRLVFLLYSEDEELMPKDTLFVQNYSLNGLASKLREDRIQFQNAMEDRVGAWASILSLFRLVFDGGGPYESYLPARHGELFDPDTYPFLEGRALDHDQNNELAKKIPLISDDVVEKILSKLLLLDGQVLSYRALDVEQIGSVYEGIMGFTVERIKNPSVGIVYRPSRQKISITVVIDSIEFLAQSPDKRIKWLKKQAGVEFKFSTRSLNSLKRASNLNELCEALDNKLSIHTPRGLNAGSLILQPTAERRKSGSHYTPRALSEPIVIETFRPWLEQFEFKPTAQEILDLKICDPSMGSGAFLVASCRFLSKYLVQAWERDGYPNEFDESYEKEIYARRLISQSCLYGIDKNIYAVSLAKLSLWLVTLSKDLPFTFLDHALKCGDSLVGFSIKEILSATNEVQLGLISGDKTLTNRLSIQRQENFAFDSRDDSEYDSKKEILEKQIKETDDMRMAGDLMVAAFFDGKNLKERYEIQKRYLGILNNSHKNINLKKDLNQILKKLILGDKGLTPFHWELEFPEVFDKSRSGFDFFIGNPPFGGKNTIASGNPKGILDWFKFIHEESHGNADYVAHFFRRCFKYLRPNGSLGLIATNTIAEGDTRSTGLRWICLNGGSIYSAIKRYKWPGVASVVVSIIHLIKGNYKGSKKLDQKNVEKISAFLFPDGVHEDPKKLIQNSGKSFVGSIILGMGFTFDDSGDSDETSTSIPIPISVLKDLKNDNTKNSQVIYPYIGGSELNSSPTHSYHRYVVDFRNLSEKECWRNWPKIMKILENKVKPERQEKNADGSFKKRYPLPQKWWVHAEKRPELYSVIRGKERVLAISRVSNTLSFAFVNPSMVFADSLVILDFQNEIYFGLLQSNIHACWARFFASSMKDDLRYSPSDCFENFPFPKLLMSQSDSGPNTNEILEKLESKSKEYYSYRKELMIKNNEGLTSTYSRFNNPFESEPKIIKFRQLQKEMDRYALDLYGWENINLKYGYGLEFLDLEEDAKIPEELKATINKEDLFFHNVEDAIYFERKILQIAKNKRKLSWRYCWPNDIKNNVLSNLLSLNSELSKNNHSLGKKLLNFGGPESDSQNNIKNNDAINISNNEIQLGMGFDR